VALVWGVAAMRAARRRLRPAPPNAAAGEDPAAATDQDGVTIAFVPGLAEGARVVHDSSGARDGEPPLGPPGEAERQAAAIIRQIERASGPNRPPTQS
jgi:hypothetical protein